MSTMQPEPIIYVIDDDDAVRQSLEFLLKTAGMTVRGFEHAKAFLDVLPQIQQGCVITDVRMPGMSGIELIGRIRAEHPQLPVLVLSMHQEEQFAVRALKLGASGYLTKDCAPEQLAEAIRKVVEGGRYITPGVADALASSIMPAQAETPHQTLSNREFQIFRMLAGGQSVNDVAHALSLSANTVSTHKRRLMDKLGIDNNAGLVRYAVSHQLIE